jgi:hypothetical protein
LIHTAEQIHYIQGACEHPLEQGWPWEAAKDAPIGKCCDVARGYCSAVLRTRFSPLIMFPRRACAERPTTMPLMPPTVRRGARLIPRTCMDMSSPDSTTTHDPIPDSGSRTCSGHSTPHQHTAPTLKLHCGAKFPFYGKCCSSDKM